MRDVIVEDNTVRIYCEVVKGKRGPEYYTKTKCHSMHRINKTIKKLQGRLGIIQNRNWVGFEFFCFNRPDAIEKWAYNQVHEVNKYQQSC